MTEVKKRYEVLIIGGGFGGICAAIQLKKQGIDDVLIVEKADALGGTWYLNTYPGAAVDVQSYLYSFSFEPYDWSRTFAKQEEILAYTNHLIDKYCLQRKSVVNEAVRQAIFVEDEALWKIETEAGLSVEAPVLINATGVLNTPRFPRIPGREKFSGPSFHSSQWDHSVDLRGLRVGVVGTGASAVQVVPAIAEGVDELYVFQRTPHWSLPRSDRPFREWERYLLRKVPGLGWLYREFLFWKNELRMIPFMKPGLMRLPRMEALWRLRKQVKDPDLRKELTPDFTIGCKRILLVNDYYPALQRENVHLITEGIEAIDAQGIELNTGSRLDLDALVYCTGFQAADFFPYALIGRDGVSIRDSWRDGAHAYLGTTIPGFPNFFILGGPNTGIGHTSALHMTESQVRYVTEAIRAMRKQGWKSIDVRHDVERAFNIDLQRRLAGTVWQTGGCKSWYQNAKGQNTTLYPSFNVDYRRRTSRFVASDYEVV